MECRQVHEALKLLLSPTVTEGVGYSRGQRKRGMKLDFIDVRRAYFHAVSKRRVFVKLPDEDAEEVSLGFARQRAAHAHTCKNGKNGVGFDHATRNGFTTDDTLWHENRSQSSFCIARGVVITSRDRRHI